MSSPSGVARLPRVCRAAALMAGAALLGHGAGMGVLPSAVMHVVVVSGLIGLGTLIAGRRLTLWALVGLPGVAQYLAHQLLTHHAGRPVSPLGISPLCAPPHVHAALHGCTGLSSAGDPRAVAMASSLRLMMLTVHGLAAVVIALVLWEGPRLSARARAALRPRALVGPVDGLVVSERPAELLNTGGRVAAVSLMCVRARPRRGPPTVRAVTAAHA